MSLEVWVHPNPQHGYVMGVDTAEGLGHGVLAASSSDVEGCCLAGEPEEVRDALIDLTEIAKRIRMGHRGSV